MSYTESLSLRLLYNKLINKAHFSVYIFPTPLLHPPHVMSPTDQVAKKKKNKLNTHNQSAHICVLVSLEKWYFFAVQMTQSERAHTNIHTHMSMRAGIWCFQRHFLWNVWPPTSIYRSRESTVILLLPYDEPLSWCQCCWYNLWLAFSFSRSLCHAA